ncbi:MAG: hypothetical protein GEV28_31690 [Actinophytocola sp.]|uniref:hypothetical protein n=1 Tax=Actinophytocola sp. TaxID=1872138 RepID=UPI001329E0C9|nr:hypothetical protein [Actinophytocola sp.]MPZ84701.1 hypothetical protein [Actinophytocola sp.]
MAEQLTTRAVEWLMSPYDQTWHVFPGEQLADQTRPFIEALCGHSVPVKLVEHTPPDRLCPPCVRALGAWMPDVTPWGMGD